MDICTLKNEFYVAFEGIEHYDCLCLISTMWNLRDALKSIMFSSSTDSEYELLFMDVLRRIAEIYTEKGMRRLHVCKEISKFLELFYDDCIWNNVINYFDRKQDKYLLYVTIKALSVIMYIFPQQLFKLRLDSLMKNMIEKENSAHYLKLLTSLVDYKYDSDTNCDNCKCKNKVPCVINPVESNYGVLCHEFSFNWNTLIDVFLRTENQNMASFLILWKTLCEKHMKGNLSNIFLKEEFALEFITLSLKMSTDCLKIYVDIISQIFCSKLVSNSWHLHGKKEYEEIVVSALISGFLSVALKERTISCCSFFSCPPTNLFNEDVKFDVTSKKIVFIVLSLLAEFHSASLLSEALAKVFDFLEMPMNKWKPQSTHFWIFDIFIEEDDLLFGVMLAFLKIYCCLKKIEDLSLQNEDPQVEIFRSELNPHKIFIKFLQQIGNDHNELLSFLVSDETCCLLYLLQYLKLLLMEWELFIQAHEIFRTGKSITPFSSSSISECVSNSLVASSSSENKLVSYSCSSSSDEENSSTTADNLVCDQNSRRLYLRTISVLMHLKVGIERLVHINEFPYNISPLLSLLKMCKEKSLNS